ncbi:uncharacterized protein LOC125670183 isoform X2 [Ostrea edulis]|uniref:uncharacterized protein LOC125670183 isoform X2 n=1 Tax=Ostrea edulis TaxID=37623 RepID=UPI0024AF9B28|nr:uncharacterized protein LOC125670183 isoform X2 [Ostrea edulis]
MLGCVTVSPKASYASQTRQCRVKNDAESKLVYWENFEKAFQENPEAIKSALLISYLRKSFPTRIYVDQHGNRYSWDRNRGFVPVNQYTRPAIPGYHQTPVYTNYQNHVPSYQIPPAPVFWAQSPQGWIPISSDPFFTSYTSYPFNVNKYWCDPTVTDFNNVIPQLSTEVSAEDPCMRQQLPDEFGLVASSGMADMLCALCQAIKSMECVWKFCSHPDGVYKVKLDY